ncbi:ABC transporter permease [Cohnella sp. CIP 111063]|jgi:ABC-type sugar transport system, permease component|uniref:carbohydrate ABC transporter permease n=1 Tax=unclassified Cohnella TaxID=2636738 RepID=UPI000B8C5190|nr:MULTISPECIES: carbohydrate ABC transporter permease [unclassified Cohnella]OXS62735.1 ABC transporter permease [Cohnella sp. CIP 111063]PRX75008.1 multiple sugar transport system permease protein/putative aldouronate transport system permease protein [Cohnella sp. SGD-V74]
MKSIRLAPKEKAFDLLNLIVLTLFGIVTLYPFYYIFIYSISDPTEALRGVYLLPRGFSLDNYRQLFQEQNILWAFFISVSRTVLGTIATLIGCTIFSYGISKPFLPFRKWMYGAVIVTMYISPGIIPVYLTMKTYGLYNNFLVYILPGVVVAFFVILIKTYMEDIPKEMEESAMVDGASAYTILWKVILPLCMPVLATVAIFNAVNQWNTWVDNLYLAPKPELQTLQLLLYTYVNQQNAALSMVTSASMSQHAVVLTPTSVQMTITFVATLPILLVYPFMQRFFLKGIMLGAVKG